MSQFLPPCLRLGNPTNQVLVTTTRRRRSVPPSGHQSCLLIIESGLLNHQQASESAEQASVPQDIRQDIRLVTRGLLAIRANSHLSHPLRLTRQTLQLKFTGNSFFRYCPKQDHAPPKRGANSRRTRHSNRHHLSYGPSKFCPNRTKIGQT